MDTQLVQWIPLLTLLYFLVQSPLSIILGMGLFKLYSYRNMLEAIITGCFILVGGYFWQLEGVVYGLIISYAINSIVVWAIMKKSFIKRDITLSLNQFGLNAIAILKKGIPYFIGNTFIGAVANIILIGLFSTHIGFEELGFLKTRIEHGIYPDGDSKCRQDGYRQLSWQSKKQMNQGLNRYR